jgi:phosphate butyryltransferase
MERTFFGNLGKDLDTGSKCRVAIPLAQDEACAYAVSRAMAAGIISPILIGNLTEIRALYGEALTRGHAELIEETNADAACKTAVQLVRDGKADIMMKGLVPTSTILKAVLHSQDGIKKNPLLSHICFFELPGKPGMKLLTDAAINIAPDGETLARIVENAVEAAQPFLTHVPKVALLAANEKVSEKVPSTSMAKHVVGLLKSRTDMVVEGPISLDLAASPESVRIKKYEGAIQGDADIFVAPRIEVGNVFYKSLQYFANAQMAGIVYGAKCPVVLTSRSDSNDTKYFSLVLGMTLWQRQNRQTPSASLQAGN